MLVDNVHLAGFGSARESQVSHHAIDPAFVDAELRAAGLEIVERQDRIIVQSFPQWLIVAKRASATVPETTAAPPPRFLRPPLSR